MGQSHSSNGPSGRSVSMSSESGLSVTGRSKAREHKRHGVVTLKMVSANPNGRRGAEQVVTHTITPKGCILYPSAIFNPAVVQHAITTSGYPLLAPSAIPLSDPRAHKILVSYCNGWHIIPFPEVFSRHSGTCLILGDRQITSPPFQMKVGDCFRLGSVGLVVSEMRADGEEEQRIDGKTLEFLKDEALAFDTNGDMATLAADEERLGQENFSGFPAGEEGGEGSVDNDGCHTPPRRGSSMDSAGETPNIFDSPYQHHKGCDHSVGTAKSQPHVPLGTGGISPGERFVCYMCYETHDTEDDALVAPCDCRGDTRYLHVQCLQKWYQASITGVQTQVIRTTGNGAPACKICGSAYKTAFRRADGRKASLLEMESNGPYLSLVVVTKHDTNPGLFNTKFRLNFHSHTRQDAALPFQDPLDDNIITIGRSSSCNMILDYRTVSTIHARITYEDGKFYLTDRRSSNGTMVYLQDPFPLPYQHSLKLRMGRTTLSLQARRNWTSALRNMFGPPIPQSEAQSPSPEEVQDILAACTPPSQGEFYDGAAHTVKEDSLTNDEEQARQERELMQHQFRHPGRDSLDGTGPFDGDAAVAGELGDRLEDLTAPHQHQHQQQVSSSSLNSVGNTSYQSMGSAMTGATGLNTMGMQISPVRAGVPAGVTRAWSGGVAGEPRRYRDIPVTSGSGRPRGRERELTEAEAAEEEAEVRRAIELSLMDLALQQQQEEERALAAQQSASGLPPLSGTKKSAAMEPEFDFAEAGEAPRAVGAHSPLGSRPQSGASNGNIAASAAIMAKSPSKAMLDYSQPELVSDSAEDLQVPLVPAGQKGAHESTLVLGTVGSGTAVKDELLTSLPTAGAFTPYGQLSNLRSGSNVPSVDSARDKAQLSRESSTGVKENARDRGALSKESSLRDKSLPARLLSRENSSSSSTGALALHQAGAGKKGLEAGAEGEGRQMLRNSTTIDLETAPSP